MIRLSKECQVIIDAVLFFGYVAALLAGSMML